MPWRLEGIYASTLRVILVTTRVGYVQSMSICLVLQTHLKVFIIQLTPSPKLPYIADTWITSGVTFYFWVTTNKVRRSQQPRGLRRRSAAARLLRLWVRIPHTARKFVCCECCVLPGTGLCDELIARPEESYWQWCVVVCDLHTSWMRRPWPTGGCRPKNKQTNKEHHITPDNELY
jgi:hypothetical protein